MYVQFAVFLEPAHIHIDMNEVTKKYSYSAFNRTLPKIIKNMKIKLFLIPMCNNILKELRN